MLRKAADAVIRRLPNSGDFLLASRKRNALASALSVNGLYNYSLQLC